MFKTDYAKRVYEFLEKENPNEKEYLAASKEILESVEMYVAAHPGYKKAKLLDRFVEPELGIEYKGVW